MTTISKLPDSALILCAGKGTRMGAISEALPKPLLPLFEGTLLSWQLTLLSRIPTLKQVFINTYHLSHLIDEYTASLTFPFEIVVLKEPTLLGSGGAFTNLKVHYPHLQNILAINADTFFLSLTPEHLHSWCSFMDRETQALLIPTPISVFSSPSRTLITEKHYLMNLSAAKQTSGTTFSGISIIHMPSINASELVSDFFNTVAPIGEMKTKVFPDVLTSDQFFDFGEPRIFAANAWRIFESYHQQKLPIDFLHFFRLSHTTAKGYNAPDLPILNFSRNAIPDNIQLPPKSVIIESTFRDYYSP